MNQIELNTAAYKAAQEGKKVQWRALDREAWYTAYSPKTLQWDFTRFAFRPLPEPSVIYVNEYATGRKNVHATAELAKHRAGSNAMRVAVKYVEAIE
jgi:hypothetical protein